MLHCLSPQYYLKELNIPHEQIRFSEKVGRGTFGEVHRGNWHGDVAIKILNDDYLYKGTDELHEAFKQDVSYGFFPFHDVMA